MDVHLINQINWSVGVDADKISDNGFYIDDSTLPTNEIFIYEGCEDDWEIYRVKIITNGEVTIKSGSEFLEDLHKDETSFAGNANLSKKIMCLGYWQWNDELEIDDGYETIINEGDDYGNEINVEDIFSNITENSGDVVITFSRRYAGGAALNDISENVDVHEDFILIPPTERACIYYKK